MDEVRADAYRLFRRERRWRRAAAILVAPAIIAPIYRIVGANYFVNHPGKALVDMLWCTEMAYLGSPFGAAIVGGALRLAKWRPSALTILPLFPLACGAVAAAFVLFLVLAYSAPDRPREWIGVPGVGGIIVVLALPVALAYCLIAGVPWRARAAD